MNIVRKFLTNNKYKLSFSQKRCIYTTFARMDNITHAAKFKSLEEVVEKKRQKIIATGDLPEATVEKQLNYLQQLTEFELGRSLLMNQGLNGHWTGYFNLYPKRKDKQPATHPLEKYLLERFPGSLSSQDRFRKNQELLQEKMRNGMKLCSIPCGVMDDLLTLDYSKVSDVKLIGIDIDKESTDLARQKAIDLKIEDKCEFYVEDAWKLSFENEFDIITSNGLNFYVSDVDMLIKLYGVFYRALKPGGKLLISILQPHHLTTCDDKEALRDSIIVYYRIIEVQFGNHRTIEETKEQLTQVGFKNIETYKLYSDRMVLFEAEK